MHSCFDDPAYTEDDPRLSSWYKDIGGGIPPMGTLAGPIEMEAGNNLIEFVFVFGEPIEVDLTIFVEPSP